MIRVVVADDQALVREGIVVLLGAQPDLEVAGEAADGADAVQVATATEPDVVLMDIRMPVLNGLGATAQILAAIPHTKVIVLTTFDIDEYVFRALRAGASGFQLEDASATTLADAVRAVARGDAMLAPTVTRRMLTEFVRLGARPAPTPEALDELTTREVDVLRLIAHGMSNAEVAEGLTISEQTVKTHVGRILEKLNLRDRTQAAILAYETGLVRPGT